MEILEEAKWKRIWYGLFTFKRIILVFVKNSSKKSKNACVKAYLLKTWCQLDLGTRSWKWRQTGVENGHNISLHKWIFMTVTDVRKWETASSHGKLWVQTLEKLKVSTRCSSAEIKKRVNYTLGEHKFKFASIKFRQVFLVLQFMMPSFTFILFFFFLRIESLVRVETHWKSSISVT